MLVGGTPGDLSHSTKTEDAAAVVRKRQLEGVSMFLIDCVILQKLELRHFCFLCLFTRAYYNDGCRYATCYACCNTFLLFSGFAEYTPFGFSLAVHFTWQFVLRSHKQAVQLVLHLTVFFRKYVSCHLSCSYPCTTTDVSYSDYYC